MGRITNKFLFLGVLAFTLWYLLTQTTLGSAFSGDITKAGSLVSTNTAEGLKTAGSYF